MKLFLVLMTAYGAGIGSLLGFTRLEGGFVMRDGDMAGLVAMLLMAVWVTVRWLRNGDRWFLA